MKVKVILREIGETMFVYYNVASITSDTPVIVNSTGRMRFACTLHWDKLENGNYPCSPVTIDMEKYIVIID